MPRVGEGTGHKSQVDELDAEIAAMEAIVRGESQQPEATPEQVATGQEQGEDVITSVDEFERAESGDELDYQEKVVPDADDDLLESEQQPEQEATTGRRSWKTDFLELDNRYKLLRQASDRHKFETKQQMAAYQEQLLRSQEEVEHLKQMVVQMQQQAPQESPFSQEDIDVLGEGTVNSMQAAIRSAVEGATKPLQAELLQMKKAERDRLRASAQSNRDQAYSSFTQRLADLVPDYPSINVDPDFIKWLKEVSPYSGAQRMTHFHQAESAGDVERVAQFFVEFKQLKMRGRQLLEESVTPSGKGGGSAAPSTKRSEKPGEKIFSMAFINKFYDDDIAGKYRGREALRDKLDAEIDQALKDGRVR